MKNWIYDIIGFIGLATMATGIWQWSWPASLVVVGIVLIIVAILGARNDTEQNTEQAESRQTDN